MAAAMCVSLAACGGSTASSSAAESTASSTAESTASSTADAASTGDEEVDLRMAWWGSQDRHDRTIKAIELYESLHPNANRWRTTPTPARRKNWSSKLLMFM